MLLDAWLFHFNMKINIWSCYKKHQLIQLPRRTEQGVTWDCGYERNLWQLHPNLGDSDKAEGFRLKISQFWCKLA